MGIRIFTGEDRVKAQEKIKRGLGEGYEIFEGENLESSDLEGLFLGTTLFFGGGEGERRRILVKDLGENKEVFNAFSEGIERFVRTEADVILFETKIDKRLSATKKLTKAGVEIVEFKKAEAVNMKAVFSIYDTALRDGVRAVRELEKIESKQDPYMFFGLMVAQALKKLEWNPNGAKEKRVLKELSKIDVLMKTASVEPWVLVESFLMRMKAI